MKIYFYTLVELAQFVAGQLANSRLGLPLTMTIQQEKSEAFSVRIVTEELSDDTEQEQVATFFSQTQVNI